MITVRIPHPLGLEGSRQRLDQLFKAKQLSCAWNAAGDVAILSKTLPFVGEAEAEVKLHEDAVEVVVTKAPAFPAADTVQRLIVDELTRALA